MPSITSHSPYETLALFQSVARHGDSNAALQNISAILKQNEHIHERTDFDINRLSVDALRALYIDHVSSRNDKSSLQMNGDADIEERSPKRRKLSETQQLQARKLSEQSHRLQEVLDQLYASYREETTRSIKQDEAAFVKLQGEIKKLEEQVATETRQQQAHDVASRSGNVKPENFTQESNSASNPKIIEPSKQDPEATPGLQASRTPNLIHSTLTDASASNVVTSAEQRPTSALPNEAPSRMVPSTQPTRVSQPPTPVQNTHPSPSPFTQQMASPTPQRPNYGPAPTQPMYSPGQGPQNHMMPQMAGAQPRPHVRNQQPGSGRGSPMPYQGQHPYSPYPQYPPPPPQWHPHMPHHPYQQHPPYGPSPQYHPQPPNIRHPQTPQSIPYPPYPHAAPVHYVQQQQQQQQQWRGQQWPAHPASAITTPVSRSDGRLSMPGSGSSTPWKRKAQTNQLRPKSPPPPEREVSPLTDDENSPVSTKMAHESKLGSSKRREEGISAQRQPPPRGRPQSVTPSAAGPSRSQSLASRNSDTQNERQSTARRGRKIKAEPPSTPLAIPSSDTEQRSSGRRGRPRSSTVTSQADGSRAMAAKRKRESISSTSPPRSSRLPSTTLPSQRTDQSHDPSLITVSKNFAKTSQLLLNEITSHKLASIFAKPLSERDAPGYKDLISRPQDLKAIKAAISKGGRAAFAAIEVIEGDSEATPIRAPSSQTQSSGPRPLGNGFFLVGKTQDLVPPKGIVNSAQLEMELVRMFANAIMFNPLPSAERGFGRSLRLRKNGGDVYAKVESEEASATEDSESGSSSGAEEGGIIADTREMFNDVVQIVGKWRGLELERMGTGADVSASRHGSVAIPPLLATETGRHASISAASNLGEEDLAAGESEAASTPVPNTSTGPGRKRRRIAEH